MQYMIRALRSHGNGGGVIDATIRSSKKLFDGAIRSGGKQSNPRAGTFAASNGDVCMTASVETADQSTGTLLLVGESGQSVCRSTTDVCASKICCVTPEAEGAWPAPQQQRSTRWPLLLSLGSLGALHVGVVQLEAARWLHVAAVSHGAVRVESVYAANMSREKNRDSA